MSAFVIIIIFVNAVFVICGCCLKQSRLCLFASMFGSSVCAFPFFFCFFISVSFFCWSFHVFYSGLLYMRTKTSKILITSSVYSTTNKNKNPTTTKQKKNNKKYVCVLLGKVLCCSCVGFLLLFRLKFTSYTYSFMFWCNMYVWLACCVLYSIQRGTFAPLCLANRAYDTFSERIGCVAYMPNAFVIPF